MKAKVISAVSLAVVGLVLIPVVAGSVAHAAQATTQEVSYVGLTFLYDKSLGSGLNMSVVPAREFSAAEASNIPYWEMYPTHLKLAFEGYTPPGALDAAIYAIPVSGRYPANATADGRNVWQTPMASLRSLLNSKLAFEKPTWLPGTDNTPPPFLPPVNAGNPYIGQQKYLSFRSGEGVRYLTYLTQAPNPIEANEILYTFQGLTSDGEYYIAARFPVALNTSLPAQNPSPDPTWVNAYNSAVFDRLNSASSTEFTPDLAHLDAMLQSISVDSSAMGLSSGVGVGMPRTGSGEFPEMGFVLAVVALATIVATGAGLLIRSVRSGA